MKRRRDDDDGDDHGGGGGVGGGGGGGVGFIAPRARVLVKGAPSALTASAAAARPAPLTPGARLASAFGARPANPYLVNKPDFAELAKVNAEFAAHVRLRSDGSVAVNWHDPAATRALTRALLLRDFGLDVTLPTDRLCPTVPQKLNYLLWIAELLAVPLRGAPAVAGISESCASLLVWRLGVFASLASPSLTLRCDGMRWDAVGLDGMEWDGMRWDGMRWDGMRWNTLALCCFPPPL